MARPRRAAASRGRIARPHRTARTGVRIPRDAAGAFRGPDPSVQRSPGTGFGSWMACTWS